jgi:RNA polymerase sigma-70 factor (ECF subfamily)
MTSFTADETLVDGLRAGRRDAFERLYTDYNAAIYNLCARILGDREEAKDVTQEVFIKAFNQLPTAGEQPLKLRPWLFRVATNACFNHLRAQKHLGAGHDAELAEMPSPVDSFAQAQTVALVEATLGQLNERYRTALVLKDLHGLPPEEIATVMDVSRPTADVLVHRARSSFKSIFAKLAGEGAAAPASLALVLVPLALPAALHLMPPTPHVAPPAHVPAAPSTHGSGGSLLSKIAPVAASKVAVAAVAASLVVGGVAIKQLTSTGHRTAGGHVTAVASPANRSAAAAHGGYLSWSMRWGWQEWSRWGGSGRLMESQMSWSLRGAGTAVMNSGSPMGSSGSSTGMSATSLSGSSPSGSGSGMLRTSSSTGSPTSSPSSSGSGMPTKSYSTGPASGSGMSTKSPAGSPTSVSGTSTMTSTTSSSSGGGM